MKTRFTLAVAAPPQAEEAVGQEASASPVTTAVKQVNLECVEHTSSLSKGSELALSPNAVDVSYPERVQPGETFTVTVQPGEMATGKKATARMKYDIALPQGVVVSNLRIVEPGTNLNATPAAVVQRVNAAGQPDENGDFARIWDGANSVNNGGNESDDWYSGFFGSIPRAGLAVEANQQFRLPKIAFDVTAPDYALPGRVPAPPTRATKTMPCPSSPARMAPVSPRMLSTATRAMRRVP